MNEECKLLLIYQLHDLGKRLANIWTRLETKMIVSYDSIQVCSADNK